MDHQTPLESHRAKHSNGFSPPEHGMRGLMYDVTTLAELQWQLFTLEAKAVLQSLIWPVVFIAASLGLVLCSVPLVLVAAAYVLIELASWPHWAGFLAASLLGLAIAGGMLWELQRRWRNRPPLFERSVAEFRQNFNRIKQLLVRSRSGQPRATRLTLIPSANRKICIPQASPL